MNTANTRSKIVLLVTLLLLVGGIALMLWSVQICDPTWKPIVRSLGSFLSVTIILGFLYKVFIRGFDDEALEARLIKVFDKKINDTFVGNAYYGLEGFVQSIDFGNIFDTLRGGETLWWLDTYDPSHHQWLSNLEEAIRRGVNVHFLVMDPNSELIRMRAVELGPQFTLERFRSDLNSFRESLRICQNNTEAATGCIEIVEYNDLPCAPLYVVEQNGIPIRGFSSLFLGEATAIGFPHIRWRAASGNYIGQMHEYLRAKWERNLSKETDPTPGNTQNSNEES